MLDLDVLWRAFIGPPAGHTIAAAAPRHDPDRAIRIRHHLCFGAANGAYLALLGALFLANRAGPELSSLTALNLYLPQWYWAVPGVVLLLANALWARLWVWAPLAGMLVVAGPLMGYGWGWGAAAPVPGTTPVRVVTYNVHAGALAPLALEELGRLRPDVVLLQEAGPSPWTRDARSRFPGWHTAGPRAGLFVASRFPILNWRVREIPVVDTANAYLWCQIEVDGVPVSVYNVHLPTPRDGLQPLLDDGAAAAGAWRLSTNDRLAHVALLARDLKRDQGPRIVAGDMNAPPPSMVLRYLTATGLRNAFSTAGTGFGFTYGHRLSRGYSFVRIDHVLVSHHWVITGASVGGEEASDHRPVVADLHLARGRLPGRFEQQPDRRAWDLSKPVGEDEPGQWGVAGKPLRPR
ncbi:MAG TPA: endonuclease/exonuclease/phosphatase family protein [Chthonomonadales bacterium]|nr:endonuclease/exonuclease/phosphatase family protein [Chthonomonadales bacterium]